MHHPSAIPTEPVTKDYAQRLARSLVEYRAPTSGDVAQMNALRSIAAEFIETILLICPPHCPDRTAAIRKVREALMTANASIVLE